MYRARDTNLEIDVALKVLKPSFAYDEVFERNFRREAHLAAKFRHPNIIAIHYVGKESEIVFFSMDLLERGVAQLVREGKPVESELIVRVGSEVASALAFAHKGGVVHRDLKPDNILFDRHGNSVVTDFGIADAITNYTEATGTTVYIGTPKYMSPEQARGQRVDHRSDVYSLGVTLYHMATGDAPFSGSDWFELGRKHIAEPPVPPREVNPALDRELERVILKCLAKEPLGRYQSADDLRQDLLSAGRSAGTVVYAGAGGPRDVAAAVPLRKRAPSRIQFTPPVERRGRLNVLLLAASIAAAGLAYDRDVAGVQERTRELWNRVQPKEFYVSTWPGGGLEPTAAITLHLTKPANPGTVSRGSVRLVDLLGAPVPIIRVSVSQDGRSIIVVPDTLEYGKRYNLVIDSTVTDLAGNPIRASFQRDRVGVRLALETVPRPPDTQGPRVQAIDPEPGSYVGPRPTFTVTFDEPVRLETVDATSIQLRDSSGATVGARLLVNAADTRTVSVEPERPLEQGTEYTLEVSGSVTDTLGNPGAAQRFAYRARLGGGDPAAAARLRVRAPVIDPGFQLEIHVDGILAGEGSSVRVPVRAGTHRVEVYGKVKESANKLKVYENDHRVGAGDTVTVRPTLQEFGALYVSTRPPSGRVFVNDAEVGSTPLVAWPLRAGTYTLRIEPPSGLEETYAPIHEQIVVERYGKRNLRTLDFERR